MECNPNFLMKTHHELCESQFYKEIGKKILGNKGMRLWELYLLQVNEKKKDFLVMKKN
jgi:hypothetical protein